MDNNIPKHKLDKSVFDGLFMKNTVLASGLVVAPIAAVATTVENAYALAVSFSCITFLTILIASFVPREIVYAVRIILYTIIAAMVYVPVIIFMDMFMEPQITSLGIMLPLLITNSLIITRSEVQFFRVSKQRMIAESIAYIFGFDIAALLVGFIREVFASGSLGDKILGIPITFPSLSTTFGGFILLGILAAVLKKIKLTIRSNAQ